MKTPNVFYAPFLRAARVGLGALALGAVVLTGCNNSDDDDAGADAAKDTTRPVITVATPMNAQIAPAGAPLLVNLSVTDNSNLAQVRLEIHNAFDGHTHGKTADAFEMDTIINVSGLVATVNLSVNIPGDALAGPYHVMFNCLDAAGNEAEFVERDIVISNTSQPIITEFKVNGETPEDEVHVHFESGMTTINQLITARLSDTDGLDHVMIKVVGANEHSHGKTAEEPAYEYEEELGGAQSKEFSHTVPFDASKLENNHEYELQMIVKDETGHHAIQKQIFHVMK